MLGGSASLSANCTPTRGWKHLLEPKDVPGDLKLGPHAYQWSEGAWLRLDATPAADAPQSLLRTLSTTSWLYWFDQLWDHYVIQMDRSRQREAIYQPVHDAVTEVARSVADLTWWRGLFKSIRGLLGLDRWTGLSGEWLDGLLATALAIGLFTIGHWGFRATRAVWVRSTGGPQDARQAVAAEPSCLLPPAGICFGPLRDDSFRFTYAMGICQGSRNEIGAKDGRRAIGRNPRPGG